MRHLYATYLWVDKSRRENDDFAASATVSRSLLISSQVIILFPRQVKKTRDTLELYPEY